MLGTLDDGEIERLLQSELIAHVGCHADDRTYVVPITYVYENGALIGHSAGGMKLDMWRSNPEVCIEVEHIADPANWRSVIAWGRYEELSGEAAEAALGSLMARLVPVVASETSRPDSALTPSMLARDIAARETTVYRIVLEQKTGRYERSR